MPRYGSSIKTEPKGPEPRVARIAAGFRTDKPVAEVGDEEPIEITFYHAPAVDSVQDGFFKGVPQKQTVVIPKLYGARLLRALADILDHGSSGS